MQRLTKWEGRNPDGSPRAVMIEREGLFSENFQKVLAKLARYEDYTESRINCHEEEPYIE